MKVKTTAAITALKKFTQWVKKLKSADEDAQNQAVNIVTGCFRVLAASPTMDLRAWVDRLPRRKKLRNPAKAVQFKTGRQAITELIEITVLELEASKPFLTEVDVGPLPVEPRKLSPEHCAKLQAGNKNRWVQKRKMREESYRHHGVEKALLCLRRPHIPG